MPEVAKKTDENVVYVGKKPTMNYVLEEKFKAFIE